MVSDTITQQDPAISYIASSVESTMLYFLQWEKSTSRTLYLTASGSCSYQCTSALYRLPSPRHNDSRRWRWNIVSRIFFNLLDILIQINLFRFQPLRLLEQLPAHEQYWKHSDHGVREEKGRYAPLAWHEHSISANKSEGEASDECVPCQIWLEPALVGKSVSR